LTILIEHLPPYESISQPDIAKAAASWDAAKSAMSEAKRSLVQAEQELPNAATADAEADERSRSAGKGKLKGRPATVAAEKAIAGLAHEHQVSTIHSEKAYASLQEALELHLPAWQGEVASEVDRFDGGWENALQALLELHSEPVRAVNIGRQIGLDHVGVGSIRLDRRQLEGVELQNGSSQTAHVAVEDVLAGLQILGQPVPEPEPPRPVKATSLNRSPVEDEGGWQAEKQQQEAFLQRMAEDRADLAERQSEHNLQEAEA
jgi:hypothetical protein